MISHEEAEARVARGAAFLDGYRPGWAHEINPGTLKLESDYCCILGQLAGGYHWAMSMIPGAGSSAFRREFGFTANLDEGDLCEGFRLLQDAWIAAIAARLCADSQDAKAQEYAAEVPACPA